MGFGSSFWRVPKECHFGNMFGESEQKGTSTERTLYIIEVASFKGADNLEQIKIQPVLRSHHSWTATTRHSSPFFTPTLLEWSLPNSSSHHQRDYNQHLERGEVGIRDKSSTYLTSFALRIALDIVCFQRGPTWSHLPNFESLFCYFLAGGLGASYLTSLCFSFPICNMKIIIVFSNRITIKCLLKKDLTRKT